jgi:hypothetical protein
MGFDVFVQGFHDGDARTEADADVVEAVLAPYVVGRDEQLIRVRVGDDEGEIYGASDLDGGFMVTHAGPAVFDVVVEVAKAADLVILPVGCPTVIVDEAQRAHLPEDLTENVVLVTSGEDLRRVIAS